MYNRIYIYNYGEHWPINPRRNAITYLSCPFGRFGKKQIANIQGNLPGSTRTRIPKCWELRSCGTSVKPTVAGNVVRGCNMHWWGSLPTFAPWVRLQVVSGAKWFWGNIQLLSQFQARDWGLRMVEMVNWKIGQPHGFV